MPPTPGRLCARRAGFGRAPIFLLTLCCGLGAPQAAHAVRFSLGLAADLVPIVIDQNERNASSARFGLLPVIELEPNPYLSIGTYTPFTLVRAGGSDIGSSSGAESIFGFQVSGRYPIWRDTSPDEILLYGTLRGGFGTVDARAGPFVGGAVGAAFSWLDSGAGLFGELGVGYLSVSDLNAEEDFARRWWVGLSLGFVFRLGGESWAVEYRQ